MISRRLYRWLGQEEAFVDSLELHLDTLSHNGRAQKGKTEPDITRDEMPDRWEYLSKIEGQPYAVSFNDLGRLYELFDFKITFDGDRGQVEVTLPGADIREYYKYPGDTNVRVEYVERAIILIKETHT